MSCVVCSLYFFFSSRRRHTRSKRDWSSDVCSSDLLPEEYFAADMQASAAANTGQWRRSQESVRRAIDLATRVDVKEVAARYAARSEERRVGKECRCGWSRYH